MIYALDRSAPCRNRRYIQQVAVQQCVAATLSMVDVPDTLCWPRHAGNRGFVTYATTIRTHGAKNCRLIVIVLTKKINDMSPRDTFPSLRFPSTGLDWRRHHLHVSNVSEISTSASRHRLGLITNLLEVVCSINSKYRSLALQRCVTMRYDIVLNGNGPVYGRGCFYEFQQD